MVRCCRILLISFVLMLFLVPEFASPPVSAQVGAVLRLALAPPQDLSPRDIPSLQDPLEVEAYARELVIRHAAPLLADLDRLREKGIVTGYTFLPDMLAVDVQVADPVGLSQALKESDNQALVLYSLDSTQAPPECAAGLPERFRRHISDLAQIRQAMLTGRTAIDGPGAASLSVPSPSPIEVGMMRKGGYASAFGGTVSPNRVVKMTLLRGENLVLRDTTTSAADGSYFFTIPLGSCLSGVSTYIKEGDQILVEDGLASYSMVVHGIDAFELDPFQNTLKGSTTPGRRVLVELHNLPTTPGAGQVNCDGTVSRVWLSPNPQTGDFSTSLPDFNSSAWVTASSFDSSNNRAFVMHKAYNIWNRDFSYAYVLFRPDTTYTVQIIRGGQTFYTEAMSTNEYGSISLDGGPWSFLPKDTIRVSGMNETMELKLDIFWPSADSINPEEKKITGKVSPNRLVRAEITPYQGSSFSMGCGAGNCVAGFADKNGNFSLDVPGMLPGDRYDITVFDAQGNQEYGKTELPLLAANLSTNFIYGRLFSTYSEYNVTMRVKDATGGLLEEKTTGTYGDFIFFSDTTLLPGYLVEVSSGSVEKTLTMMVGNPQARARLSQNILTGSASAGQLFTYMQNFQPEYNRTEVFCQSAMVNDAYQVALPRANLSGDVVQAILVGPDGGVTITHARPFTLKIYQNILSGYTETPGAEVTLTHTHSGEALAPVMTTSTVSDASFDITSLAPFIRDDRISIQTSDGVNITITVPDLQAGLNSQRDSIIGYAIPYQPVLLTITRRTSTTEERRKFTTVADANGNFTYPLNREYWFVSCKEISAADACTRVDLSAYSTENFEFSLFGEQSSAQPDRFEPLDNQPENAEDFFPGQTHTFHTAEDIDWYRFPVLTSTTGTYTFNLKSRGTSFQVKGTLYRDNQDVPIQEFILPLSGLDTPVTISLSEPGVYYLRVAPADPAFQPACDTFYVLNISPSPWVPRLYLPIAQK